MRKVLVTGANKGIGEAIVRKLLSENDDMLVLLGSRSPENGHAAKERILQDIPASRDRLEVIVIDVSSDVSVSTAAKEFDDKHKTLYGIVNNAGIMNSLSYKDTLDVNFVGVKRVFHKFAGFLVHGGKVVNVTSASGPVFISRLEPGSPVRDVLTSKLVTVEQLDRLLDDYCAARDSGTTEHAFGDISYDYGMSKALTNAFTVLTARDNAHLVINACTPGYIATALTGKAVGEGGAKAPSEGANAPCRLLLNVKSSGHYYGSDGLRSPIDKYRAPGDDAYESETEAETAM